MTTDLFKRWLDNDHTHPYTRTHTKWIYLNFSSGYSASKICSLIVPPGPTGDTHSLRGATLSAEGLVPLCAPIPAVDSGVTLSNRTNRNQLCVRPCCFLLWLLSWKLEVIDATSRVLKSTCRTFSVCPLEACYHHHILQHICLKPQAGDIWFTWWL